MRHAPRLPSLYPALTPAPQSPSRPPRPPASSPVSAPYPYPNLSSAQDQGLRVLALVIVGYNFFFLVIGTLVIHAAISAYGPLHTLADHNINPFWFSTFTAVSSFNNVGLSLLDDNYTSLADRGAVLNIMCFMIVCGAGDKGVRP